jgi:hypothetical protein
LTQTCLRTSATAEPRRSDSFDGLLPDAGIVEVHAHQDDAVAPGQVQAGAPRRRVRAHNDQRRVTPGAAGRTSVSGDWNSVLAVAASRSRLSEDLRAGLLRWQQRSDKTVTAQASVPGLLLPVRAASGVGRFRLLPR